MTHSALYEAMDREPRILTSEMTNEGMLIGFEDGTNGLFPAALLYAILPQAQSLQAEEGRVADSGDADAPKD